VQSLLKKKTKKSLVEGTITWAQAGLLGRKKDPAKVPYGSTEVQNTQTPEDAPQRERVKKELDVLRGDLEKNAAILDSTVSRLDSVRNEYFSKSSEMDSLNKELQRKRSEIRSIRVEYVNIKSEFDKLNSELVFIRSEHNPKILESTKKEIESARTELTHLNYEREDARVSLGELRSEIDSTKSQLCDIRSKIEHARSEFELANSQYAAIKKETAAAKKELDFIRSELASPDQLNTTRKITQAAASFVASLNQKHTELKKELGIALNDLSRISEENLKLKEEKLAPSDVVQNILYAKSKLESLKIEQQKKKKEFDQTKKELEFIQRELASIYIQGSSAFTEKTQPLAKERYQAHKHKLNVLIQPVGQVDANVMEMLRAKLNEQFEDLRFELSSRSLTLPMDFINTSRNQFSSPQIISWIEKTCKEAGFDRILGICDADAYSGRLNFVLGEAQLAGRVAVVYLKMLRPEVGCSLEGEELFFKRMQKEAAHELGHIFGLVHCRQRTCVMYFSNSLADTDLKSNHMCQSCTKKLLQISN
jgi:archaemetzincin